VAVPIQICSLTIFSHIVCVKIGPVTPEITRVTSAPFLTRQQKSAYLAEYLGNCYIHLYHFSALVDICMGIPGFCCSLRNVSIVTNYFWKKICKRFCRLPSLLALSFRSEMPYRFVYARLNCAANASTSCKILLKIGPETSAENRLEFGNCDATRPLFDDIRPFVTLLFWNRLEYRNSDFSRLIISLHGVKFS